MAKRILASDWGWRCVLQAQSHDWATNPVTRFRSGNHSLEVRVGGAWRCDHRLAPETVDLLNLFLPISACAGPLVIAQIGQSLDGRIATENGASHYINGLEARTHLHRLRAVVDAVVVGVGTVNDDDPLLTVRHVEGRNPLRVVLDPRGRMGGERQLAHDGAAPTIQLVRGACPAEAGASLAVSPEAEPHSMRNGAREGVAQGVEAKSGMRQVAFPVTAQGGFEPLAVLDWLHAQGLRRVLIEGGGVTVSRFMQAEALDRMHVMVAPLLIGSGRPGLQLPPVQRLEDARRPSCRTFRCGQDTIFDLDLRRAAHVDQAV